MVGPTMLASRMRRVCRASGNAESSEGTPRGAAVVRDVTPRPGDKLLTASGTLAHAEPDQHHAQAERAKTDPLRDLMVFFDVGLDAADLHHILFLGVGRRTDEHEQPARNQ